MRLRLTAALPLLLVAGGARAHDADIVYARVQRPHSGEVVEHLTLTGSTLVTLAPADVSGDGELSQTELDERRAVIELGVWDSVPLSSSAGPCAREDTRAELQEGYVELIGRFRCPDGELKQEFRILSVLPAGYRVILESEGGAGGQRFAEGTAQTLIIDTAQPGRTGALGLAGWIELGVFHIFTGYDHLAFLVALLLVGQGWRRVLWMVTSFTIAHSITLGATALGLIPLGPSQQRWVEVAIAASIVFVAVENLVRKEHRHRALVTFGFGLVHGFGFASVLASYGLGQSVAAGLLGFNLGVELGQACIVLVLFPLVRVLQRRPVAAGWVTRIASAGIFAAGGFWLVQRALG